jgi:glycosyltransferase involved in cell wall biosynthesis
MLDRQLKISVIMAVYKGDTDIQVKSALDSICKQTRVPDEFIVVVDGPISTAVKDTLQSFSIEKLIKIIWLKNNVGRGQARNIAIKASDGELIGIMDADDISRPDRLEQQVNFLLSRDIDMCGGFIEEFSQQPGDQCIYRKVPLENKKIYRQLRYRSAFNHVTLLFKRSLYESVGGYQTLNWAEDWDFYLRCAAEKASFANMDVILVDVKKNIIRSSGLINFKDELMVLSGAYKREQIGVMNLSIQVFVRFIKAITPITFRSWIHKFARTLS